MKSMTGFGRGGVETDFGKVSVEARSENHRFLDINFQLPEAISSFEPSLIEIVKEFMSRGKVRITIVAEGLKNKSPVINTKLAEDFRSTLERLKKELGIKEKIKIEHILMDKEFFSFEENKALSKEDHDEIERDWKQRTLIAERLTGKIEAKRENFTKELAEKLRGRIKELLNEIEIDETRLYQEVAILADRSDITEETVRLKAHINKFKETFNKDGSIGRELDFLLQEMNREAGTISAKSKDAEISHLIVELRSEIEKMREQAQNIE